MAKLISFLHFLVILAFYYNSFQAINATHQKSSGFSLKMVHWNSPELPSHQPNLTHKETMDELVRISDARLKTLEQLTVFNNSSNGFIRPRLEAVMSRGVYLVQVGIGTFLTHPRFKTYYLLLDTATDQTWTQCEGCNPCFHQRGPHFPWSQSRTYHSIPCTHCQSSCHQGQCVVTLKYGGSEYISGAMAKDDFIFQADQDSIILPQVDFICVFGSQGFMGGNLPQDNVASGVLALGRHGYKSLMRGLQDTHIKNGKFSYCLQPLDEPIQHPMYLRFGRDIPHLPIGRHATTRILKDHNPGGRSFYYLELLDLEVEGKKLGIDPRVFMIKRDGSGGCIIDSATPMSYIPRVSYDRLEQSIAQHFEAMNPGEIKRVDSPFPALPLCYEQSNTEIPTYPVVTFHFAPQVDLDVSKAIGSYIHNGQKLHCLQILRGNGATTVLGAMQQLNRRFVYDTQQSVLHFYREDCELFN